MSDTPLEPIKLPHGKLFIETFGKKFEVKYICYTDILANQFMKENEETSFIATDNNGLIYIANSKETK